MIWWCLAEVHLNVQITGSGGVPGWTFGRKVEVRIGAVQEGFPPLAVRKVGLYDQSRARAGLGVQGTASHRQSVLHIETEEREGETGNWFFKGKRQPQGIPPLLKPWRRTIFTLKMNDYRMQRHEVMIFLMLQNIPGWTGFCTSYSVKEKTCLTIVPISLEPKLSSRLHIPIFLSLPGNCVILQDVFIFINHESLK